MRKIAFDVDGVLLNMHAPFTRWVEKKFGVVIHESDIHYWDLDYTFDIPATLLPEMWTYIWKQPLAPYPGALAMLRNFKALPNWTIYLVSNRPWNSHGAREAAGRDFSTVLGIPEEQIYVTDNTPKSNVLNQIKPELFVEARLHSFHPEADGSLHL